MKVLQDEARKAEVEQAARRRGKAIDVEVAHPCRRASGRLSLTDAQCCDPPQGCIAQALLLKEAGNALYKKAQHVAACKKYREGIALFEKKRGRCLVQDQDLERSKVAMVPLHLNLAACQLELEDYKMALKNCQRAMELDPANDKARFRAGKALWGQGEVEEAQSILEGIALKARSKEVREFIDKVAQHAKCQSEKEKAVYKKMF